MMTFVWKWSGRFLGALLIFLVLFVLYGGYAYRDHALRGSEFTRGVSYLDIGSAEIAYRADGLDNEGETPVILLHAIFFDMGMWDPWASELLPVRINGGDRNPLHRAR